MPATDITSRCCPDYYKCTRCDQSCFFKEVAYIETTVFEGVSASKVYVKSQFDDCDPAGTSGDKLGWLVDKSTTINSPPQGALILTGVSGSDLYDAVGSPGAGGDACDNILDESVAQDNELWVVVCLCNKNEYFQILGGGTSASKVDTSNNAQALRNKYNCDGDNHDDECAQPQYFALNVIGATIDGSTNNATNPLDVGDYVTISGSLQTVGGASAAVYGTPSSSTADATEAQLVGGGSNDQSKSATLTEDIFRVIDRTKQIKPGCTGGYETRQAYPYPITAYISSPVIKTHATGGTTAGSAYAYLENCQDCLQAYFGFMLGDSSRATKGLDDIIDMTNSTYNNLLDSCPSTWPCSVQISRTYSLDCTIAQNNIDDGNNYARPVYPSAPTNPPEFEQEVVGGQPCNDGEIANGLTQPSGLYYESDGLAGRISKEGHYLTDNILSADRKIKEYDPGGVATTITITAEYKRNLEIDQTPTKSSACPNNVKINTEIDFDYILNSVSVSTDMSTTKGTIVANILSPTQNQLHTGCAIPPLMPAVMNVQGQECENAAGTPDALGVADRYKQTTEVTYIGAPNSGYSFKTNVYKGRLYIQRPTGHVTPFYKYIGYYGNHLESIPGVDRDGVSLEDGYPDDYILPENDASRFTTVERSIFKEDGARIGSAIDEVIPFAPYIELAAGFNVNGFNHIHQKTRDGEVVDSTAGRSDLQSVTVDATAYKLYPGNSNTSKITFGDPATDGFDLTGLPFYFDSYCTAISSMAGCSAQKTYIQYNDKLQNPSGANDTYLSRGNQNFIDQIHELDTCGKLHVVKENDGSGDIAAGEFCNDNSFCLEVYRYSSDAHFIAACYNNEITRMNGSRTGADGADDDDVVDQTTIIRYAGNGVNFRNSGLSGNTEEAVGIDSEWTQVYITAQDPWCRSCDGCISKVVPFTEGSPDNYRLIGDMGPQNAR
tara:strand:+ start:4222 stop:7065 length:2844 start_codon:yes stop_codon:yes gene_type:complete